MVDIRRPGPTRPPVRLRPVPPLDPPFTEEPADLWPRPSNAQLALDLFDRRPGRPANRHQDPRSAPTRPGGPTGPAGRPAASPGPADPLSGGLDHDDVDPQAFRVAHRFVAMCLEILNGYRPPGQIRPLAAPGQATIVAQQLARGAARSGPVKRRSTRPGVRLRRLRVCQPRPTAVEAAAVLGTTTGTSWAMALRLEQQRGTWLCTTIQVL
ncbi:Rv3235 family protein [Micromonospora sp. SH-82]|uniref:Rv3235 family protein n=1 Tax=Micromonospora sp. SH-82 TaxID=3132938 RepID=UPI003EB7F9AD